MKETNCCSVSSKGLALLAAIEVGWCPSIEGGRDISTFNRFWEIYQESLRKQMSDPPQESVQLGVEDRDEDADTRDLQDEGNVHGNPPTTAITG